MKDALAYLALLEQPNVQAFLHMIRVGEGTVGDDGYRVMFGGAHLPGLDDVPGTADDFADHPRKAITRRLAGKPWTSTAAGAYQFLSRTWDECAKALGLADFSPRNQDIAALFLIDRRRALDDVLAGRFEAAVRKCNREWASLPESPYGQPVKTMAQARASYEGAGGVFEPSAAPANRFAPEIVAALDLAPASPIHNPEGRSVMPLPAFAAAALPAIISAIPELGKLFGSGSDVAERNVKAAEIAINIVKDATGAKNAQEAAEIVAADPAQAQAARQAVADRWFELTEAGGGGIEGARRADAAVIAGDGPWWTFLRSPSFWCLLVLAPLVYMLVGSLIGLWGSATWSDDVRAGLAGSIVSSIIGAAVGYYFGQTTSRNRTPAEAVKVAPRP